MRRRQPEPAPPAYPHVVRDVLAALRSGERLDCEPEFVLAFFDACRSPYELDRIRVALEEHEARSS